jgi:hypothetical protein
MARRCPLMFAVEKSGGVFGSSTGECIGEKCMWFLDDECAVFIIAKGTPKVRG